MKKQGSIPEDGMRERLLVAAIREFETHGIRDFSLRRVAASCHLSCAAPYKHFRSKEHLLQEILNYIDSRWQMLMNEVLLAVSDEEEAIVELSVALVRFLVANPSYIAIILEKSNPESLSSLSIPHPENSLSRLLCEYGYHRKRSYDSIRSVEYRIRSMIYGTVLLILRSAKDADEEIRILREALQDILQTA